MMIYLDIYLDILPIFGGYHIFRRTRIWEALHFAVVIFVFMEAATALDTPHTLVVSCFLPATPHEMGRGIFNPLAIARKVHGCFPSSVGYGVQLISFVKIRVWPRVTTDLHLSMILNPLTLGKI